MQKLLRKLDGRYWNFLVWAVAALVFTIPLYMKFPLLKVGGSFVAIRLEDFLIFITFGLWFVSILPNWKEVFKEKINIAILVYFLVSFVSVLSGIFLTHGVNPSVGLLHWLRRIEYMGAFFVGYQIIRTQNNLGFYIKCLILVVLIAFLYGVGQKYFSFPVIMTQNAEYSKGVALRYTPGAHLISTFAGHYDLATFLVLVMPIFLSLLLNKKALEEINIAKSQIKTKIFLVITLFCGGWLLINSASRISIVSLLIALLLTAILVRKYLAIPLIVLIAIVWVAFSGNLLVRYNRIIDVVRDKVKLNYVLPKFEVVAAEKPKIAFALPKVLSATEDRSTNIRLKVEWPRAFRALKKNPLLGTGFSSLTLATDNDYLRSLGETGILGFMGLVLVFVRLVIEIVKRLPAPKVIGLKDAYLVAMAGAIPGVLLNAVFIDVFEASKFAIMFWLLMGFLVGAKNEKT